MQKCQSYKTLKIEPFLNIYALGQHKSALLCHIGSTYLWVYLRINNKYKWVNLCTSAGLIEARPQNGSIFEVLYLHDLHYGSCTLQFQNMGIAIRNKLVLPKLLCVLKVNSLLGTGRKDQ